MSLFGKMLEKLGLRKPAQEPKSTTPPRTSTSTAPGTATTGGAATAGTGAARPAAPPPPPKPTPMSEVDVAEKLEALAAANPQKLNWRTSIVDLMKLLGMESSLAERKELATELGYKDDMGDSAKMNVWLHKQVLRKFAENGGKVPKELLD